MDAKVCNAVRTVIIGKGGQKPREMTRGGVVCANFEWESAHISSANCRASGAGSWTGASPGALLISGYKGGWDEGRVRIGGLRLIRVMNRGTGRMRVTAPGPGDADVSPVVSPACGKNLRWTALALVGKMSRVRERLSSQIADEIAADASKEMKGTYPARDCAAVERNTRRRVYDALKVMVAVGCIERYGKSLRWVGVDDLRAELLPPPPPASPSSDDGATPSPADSAKVPDAGSVTPVCPKLRCTVVAAPNLSPAQASRVSKSGHDGPAAPRPTTTASEPISADELRAAICAARGRIREKQATIKELEERVDAFSAHGKRRREQEEQDARMSPKRAVGADPRITFPMVVVSGPRPDVAFTPDRKRMRISTSAPFALYSETDLINLMMCKHEKKTSKLAAASGRKPRAYRKKHTLPERKSASAATGVGSTRKPVAPKVKSMLMAQTVTGSGSTSLPSSPPKPGAVAMASAQLTQPQQPMDVSENPDALVHNSELGIPPLTDGDGSECGSESDSDDLWTTKPSLGQSVTLRQLTSRNKA